MDHNKRPIISPKITITDDDVDHHRSTCIKMDILPLEQDMTEGAHDDEVVQVNIKVTTLKIIHHR